jgi:hypothetical protein
MVKKSLLFFLLLFSLFLNAQTLEKQSGQEDLLTEKIKSLLDPKVYKENAAFIKIIFSPKEDFYYSERVDVVKVVQTLKDNGLLNLFFLKPQELTLNFKTSGAPLFFVKIMGDSLRNMGYYRYVTKESTLNESEFIWTITFTSEYATDPLILQKELQKNGCDIIDIQRESSVDWTYTVDMRDANLNIVRLDQEKEFQLKRSLYAHWLDVSRVQKMKIQSSSRNNWYPYIAYYDRSMHLLEVIKKDKKVRTLYLEIPRYAKYIKISDLYTLKNIKDELILLPTATR